MRLCAKTIARGETRAVRRFRASKRPTTGRPLPTIKIPRAQKGDGDAEMLQDLNRKSNPHHANRGAEKGVGSKEQGNKNRRNIREEGKNGRGEHMKKTAKVRKEVKAKRKKGGPNPKKVPEKRKWRNNWTGKKNTTGTPETG